MDLVLHTCCGPCLLMPYGEFKAAGDRVVVHYHNPNIHPYSEYLRRLEAARDYCAGEGVEFEQAPYEPEEYLAAVMPNTAKPDRCRACYRLRLASAASSALRHGIDTISTTLLVSPYQFHEDIRLVGERVAADHGVKFHYRDFRPLYRESVVLSRGLGMYRQNYCGCLFSEKERIMERQAKKGIS